MKLLLEQIINSNYIKYNRLTSMVNSAFVGSNATTLNIYIDLYSMIKGLYHNENYDIDNYNGLTSCIINMVAHYREFFKSRYHVQTKFYIVYSKNCPYVNNQFQYGYNSKISFSFETDKKTDDMIQNNIELLETLCPYLPDIFFIKGSFETGVIIYDLICRNEMTDMAPHVVITKDVYNYQLVAMRDNITIFRPKKVNGEDNSYFINQKNVMAYYLASRKAHANDKLKTLMPGTLSLLMTLSSVKERNITMVTNINTAINLVKDAIDQCKILNGYNMIIEDVWDALNNDKINLNKIDFVNRFKAIDIQSQHLIYINTAEAKNVNLLNLVNDEAVREINNKYFIENPLDLNAL